MRVCSKPLSFLLKIKTVQWRNRCLDQHHLMRPYLSIYSETLWEQNCDVSDPFVSRGLFVSFCSQTDPVYFYHDVISPSWQFDVLWSVQTWRTLFVSAALNNNWTTLMLKIDSVWLWLSFSFYLFLSFFSPYCNSFTYWVILVPSLCHAFTPFPFLQFNLICFIKGSICRVNTVYSHIYTLWQTFISSSISMFPSSVFC